MKQILLDNGKWFNPSDPKCKSFPCLLDEKFTPETTVYKIGKSGKRKRVKLWYEQLFRTGKGNWVHWMVKQNGNNTFTQIDNEAAKFYFERNGYTPDGEPTTEHPINEVFVDFDEV